MLIDGPCSGVPRQEYRIKNLHLTTLSAKFPFSSPTRIVRKAWETAEVSQRWSDSNWAKRMEMKARRTKLNDFDRFKLYKAKQARNKIMAKAINTQKNKLVKAKKL